MKDGDIKIGDKLKICLARKEGGRACEPLENASIETSLQLGRNYVRKARWYERLGYHRINGNKFRVSLKSIKSAGGAVPYIYCCITKKHCKLYSIKFDGQRGSVYNENAKEKANRVYSEQRNAKMI